MPWDSRRRRKSLACLAIWEGRSWHGLVNTHVFGHVYPALQRFDRRCFWALAATLRRARRPSCSANSPFFRHAHTSSARCCRCKSAESRRDRQCLGARRGSRGSTSCARRCRHRQRCAISSKRALSLPTPTALRKTMRTALDAHRDADQGRQRHPRPQGLAGVGALHLPGGCAALIMRYSKVMGLAPYDSSVAVLLQPGGGQAADLHGSVCGRVRRAGRGGAARRAILPGNAGEGAAMAYWRAPTPKTCHSASRLKVGISHLRRAPR